MNKGCAALAALCCQFHDYDLVCWPALSMYQLKNGGMTNLAKL